MTRIVIKYRNQYVASIYRDEIIWGNRVEHARQYKNMNYVKHLCDKLNFRPSETETEHIVVNDGEIRILK